MQKGILSQTFLGLGAVLVLVPTRVRADFLIQFVDNARVAVHRYVEEGQAIKVYTPQGAISFPREDVASITEIDTNRSMILPLETVSASLFPVGQESAPTASEGQGTPDRDKVTGEMTAAKDNTAAKVARLNTAYKDVEQQINELLTKHSHDMELGASEETLAEDSQRLDELNNERHKLIADVRQTVPDDLPAWAQ